jgi:hypothetical protein
MLTSGVVLLHDNVYPYTAACIWALLEHFSWKLSEHCWRISVGFVWPPSLQPWFCSKQLSPVYLLEELVEIIALQ